MATYEWPAWETQQHPPRTSSRWPAPGIMVNVEFGLSFSDRDPPHTASLKYKTKNMQRRMYRQQQEGSYRLQSPPQHPPSLVPGGDYYRQPRARSLDINPRDTLERGVSAPPALQDISPPVSPVSMMSPLSPAQRTISPLQTTSLSIDLSNRSLSAEPSRFRLGESGLPWTSEPWYRPEEETAYFSPTFTSPTFSPRGHATAMNGIDLGERRNEDPQRAREMGNLHQAMMTVDSLGPEGWDAWTWDSVGDIPRGPRSLGWAVSTNPSPDREHPQQQFNLEPPPPPYVVSQWESACGRRAVRPRSASS